MGLTATTASDFSEQLTRLYKSGMPPGYPTGWDCLNEYYTILPGQLTLVTGIPSHGKSTWLEALSVNLAWMGWKFAIYSPEHEPPEVHIATLCEKVLQKPFRQGFNGQMVPAELAEAVGFIDEHYRFLRVPEDSTTIPSLTEILEISNELFQTWLNEDEKTQVGLIIDPWNELKHEYVEQETKYIGEQLGLLRRCCRNWDCHSWLVAHPKQLLKNPKTGEYPIPRPYDISGSAHWYNKADNCITIWRSENESEDVEVHVQKVKFRHVGKKGIVHLSFNPGHGTYSEPRAYWATPPVDFMAKSSGDF